ncbi:hypothetical protein KGQ24_00715 [Patescibacteria group bacterium]|nr:hypothetical protein [Patescibacteria group bacterium]
MRTDNLQSFRELFLSSVSRSNAQLVVLLKAGSVLFLFFFRDLLLSLVPMIFGYLAGGTSGKVLDAISVLLVAALFVKYNGALGLILTETAAEKKDSAAMAGRAAKNGMRFFIHAARAGVVLFFGQPLIACPCFLFLNNFIFSPYLYVYEGLDARAARKRSVELSRGIAWLVLARTVGLLGIGYAFLFVSLALLLIHSYLLALILLAVIAVYFGLIQSNFIRGFYLQARDLPDSLRHAPANLKFKTLTVFSILILLIFYVIFKLFPKL